LERTYYLALPCAFMLTATCGNLILHMKEKLLSLVVSTLLFTISTQAQGWLTNGLVAYYPLDGNANDASGNGFNGTPTAVTYGIDRSGQPFKAAVFDGISSTIPIYGLSNGNFFPVTLSVWVNGSPTFGSDYGVICKYAVSSANGFGVFATLNYLHSFYFGSQGNVYGSNQGLKGLNTLDSKWHQIVVTYDSNGGVIYVDGFAVDSVAWTGNPSAATSLEPVIIGEYRSSEGTDSRKFTGSLDDVRIYNRALSSTEVGQLHALESFCSPHAAQAIATLSGDGVAGATMVDYGCGYTNSPSVRIVGGGGSNATAIANMTGGIITDLVITSAGSGYTNAPRILIESPPYVPTVSIFVSKVKVAQHVRVNHTYVLEVTSDFVTWTPTGPAFTAESESIVNEFDVVSVGRYYRLREVP
jgi:Concanavalin A-like lectin/glucanases superfamily